MLQSLILWDEQCSSLIYKALNTNISRSRKFILYSMRMHSLSVDGLLWFPLVPLILSLSSSMHFSLQLLEIYMGTLFAAVLELAIKWIVGRKRPNLEVNKKQRFVEAENYSFPSGHALRAFYIAAWISSRHRHTLGLILWALLVGISRIASGRHFFLDVVFGGVLGTALAYAIDFKSTAQLFAWLIV